ncbi:zinc finger, CCHC-type containing protein [Tanacetum coccineum]
MLWGHENTGNSNGVDSNLVPNKLGSKQVGLKQLGSKQVGFKQLGHKQVGFKQLGPGVETGVHGAHDEKHVWFEVELQGDQGDCEAEVFQVSNDDIAVAQRRLKDKQPEEKTNTDYLRSTQQYMKSGVAKHLGAAGLQQQNGLSGLSKDLWAEDTTMSTYLVNRSPSSRLDFKTPGAALSEELFSYREDSNGAAFAVAAKAVLKDDMDDRSDVYVLSNGCRKCSDDNDVYYWEYTPAKGNVLGMEIVRDQSGNTLRVSQSRFYNGKLVQTLLEGHSILSLEGSLSGDCDVEKNGKWSCIYAVGSQEYQMVCTRLDIASDDVGMLDGFDRGLQTDLHVFCGFLTTAMGNQSQRGYLAKWDYAIESGFELKIIVGISTGALSKAIPGSSYVSTRFRVGFLPPSSLQRVVFQIPLYLHPSDGPNSLTVQEKLNGAQNYCAWRRMIEIGLSTKRKLEFIRGTVPRSPTDANLAELWDTCNNMEESQRVLFGSSPVESTALLSKGKFQEKYSICGFKWHPSEKCQVTVAHVESGNVSFTPQQFGQLLRSFQIKNAAADDDAEFAHDFAIVQVLATKRVIGLGKLKYGLYHLVNVPADKVDQVFSSLVKVVVHKFSLSVVGSLNSPNKTNNDAYALWHHRLGHVSDSKLKHMKDLPVVMSKSHSAERLSCPMAKFAKLPYAQSDSHSTEVVELIHIDIWGPYKVATADKYRYFLKIVYDCSRANWTYLLVHKSDSFLALKAFIKFVHTQFNKLVKVVRSDNALEFVKGECGPYLQSQVQKDLANFKGWCLGMDSELRALEKNGTWDLIELPPGKKAIGSHWIFKTKLKADATVEKRKPDLLCKGIHRQESFALVAKMVTLGSLLAVAALKGWDTCQMDVSNAFLHGDLLEEVYMRVPLGYAGKGESVNVDSQLDKSLVCKLKKSLYGLKQAPRQWFSMLSSPLFFFGFVQSKTDYSLFVKKDNQKFIVVLVYVDDLLFTGNDKPKIQLLKSQLSSTSHMNDLGDLSYFLGLEVSK